MPFQRSCACPTLFAPKNNKMWQNPRRQFHSSSVVLLERPIRNADLLGHKLNPRPLPRVSMTEIDLPDELVDLIVECVLAPIGRLRALGDDNCGRWTIRARLARV
jgi:hypothetical protein